MLQLVERQYDAFTGRYAAVSVAKTFRLADIIRCHSKTALPALGDEVRLFV